MSDNRKEGESHTQRNAKREGIEDCGAEDEEHESKFGPASDMDEKFDVVGGFFNKGIGHNGYHS